MPPLSRKNPRVQAARLLARDAKQRAETGLFLIEGPKLVREALTGSLEIVEAFLSPALAARIDGPKLGDDLAGAGVPLLELDDDTLTDLSSLQIAQGIVVVARIPDHGGAEALLEGPGDLLLAAGVQDPGNAGALVRIAAGAGFAGVVADATTADFFSPKAVRGSAGAMLRLHALRVEDLAGFAGRFTWEGGTLIAATPRGGADPGEVDLGKRVAVALGGEGRGLPQALIDAANATVTIPMNAAIESLNVSAAAAILAFEVRRRRAKSPG